MVPKVAALSQAGLPKGAQPGASPPAKASGAVDPSGFAPASKAASWGNQDSWGQKDQWDSPKKDQWDGHKKGQWDGSKKDQWDTPKKDHWDSWGNNNDWGNNDQGGGSGSGWGNSGAKSSGAGLGSWGASKASAPMEKAATPVMGMAVSKAKSLGAVAPAHPPPGAGKPDPLDDFFSSRPNAAAGGGRGSFQAEEANFGVPKGASNAGWGKASLQGAPHSASKGGPPMSAMGGSKAAMAAPPVAKYGW